MNPQPQSIYQRVIDRTKSIGFQTQFLAQCIEKVTIANEARQRQLEGMRNITAGGGVSTIKLDRVID